MQKPNDKHSYKVQIKSMKHHFLFYRLAKIKHLIKPILGKLEETNILIHYW
jgi:hypothetical protein